MKISIVIPYWNGAEKIKKHLPGVLEFAGANKVEEIVASDDASTDETVNLLKSEFPEVVVVERKKNEGFASNVNTGFAHAKGDIIFLLNSDASAGMDVLRYALPHFEDPKVFAVSTHETGYGGAKGFWADGYIQLGMNEETKSVHQSFYVSGGSGVFRKSIWQELGGMDEKLLSPFYWEDIDLCYRATKRGYINLWEPNGKVVHQHESTISKFPKKYVARVKERNQLLMLWKNIHSRNLIKKHLLGLISRSFKHPGYIRIIIMALGRFSIMLKARTKEIKESKVSDETIFAQFQ